MVHTTPPPEDIEPGFTTEHALQAVDDAYSEKYPAAHAVHDWADVVYDPARHVWHEVEPAKLYNGTVQVVLMFAVQ